MSELFTGLAKTLYPNDIDITADFTDKPTTDAARLNSDWDINEDNVHYIMADDVNVLLDSVLAIQKILGTMPHGAAADVKTRLTNAETALTTHKTSTDHDSRYGGNDWTVDQTIVGHTHVGGTGKPAKVNMVDHVTGLLRKTNMELTYNATGALTGSDIATSTSSATTVTTAISNRLPLTGGTLTGNLTAPVFVSNVSSGTAPLQVSSNTQVTNLNANFIMGRRVYVQDTEPVTKSANDIWIET